MKWPSSKQFFNFSNQLNFEIPFFSPSFTTVMFGPSLTSVVNDGDTISGVGFTADILTSCICAVSQS